MSSLLSAIAALIPNSKYNITTTLSSNGFTLIFLSLIFFYFGYPHLAYGLFVSGLINVLYSNSLRAYWMDTNRKLLDSEDFRKEELRHKAKTLISEGAESTTYPSPKDTRQKL